MRLSLWEQSKSRHIVYRELRYLCTKTQGAEGISIDRDGGFLYIFQIIVYLSFLVFCADEVSASADSLAESVLINRYVLHP